VLRPDGRQGDDSRDSLEVAGTARLTLPPQQGRALIEGKCWEPQGHGLAPGGSQPSPFSDSPGGRTQPHNTR